MHVFVCTNLTQNSSTYTQAPRHTKEAKHIQLVESRIHTETHTAVGKGTQKQQQHTQRPGQQLYQRWLDVRVFQRGNTCLLVVEMHKSWAHHLPQSPRFMAVMLFAPICTSYRWIKSLLSPVKADKALKVVIFNNRTCIVIKYEAIIWLDISCASPFPSIGCCKKYYEKKEWHVHVGMKSMAVLVCLQYKNLIQSFISRANIQNTSSENGLKTCPCQQSKINKQTFFVINLHLSVPFLKVFISGY